MSEREYTMKDLVKGLNENRVCICIMHAEDLHYIIIHLYKIYHIKQCIQCTELNKVNKYDV